MAQDTGQDTNLISGLITEGEQPGTEEEKCEHLQLTREVGAQRLMTVGTGTVHLELSVCVRKIPDV